ncbi:hypothetical protein HYH02_006342 [Chlamydomonas schloesseri]|uniref:Misato Segment II tubulin-like domain-containing protein n=1 Tax=Chlamydomonas schloesseri TaxID=2026947 RepID=A0A835WJ85_9CHLO|nr:hypothetical protein HYH02_006342 [Chlamydomonas schloesseri]|eukprot:KAG2448450.1 hypothetical protein HYH02_006342 [Chlamydomonas schloesseri]
MPKEIVTLSFGSYASFVSAHYWNLQDEAAGYSGREGWSEYADCVEYDALFSSSESRNGAMTYRPRAAWFDLAGSSGGASHRAEAAAAAAAAATGGSAAVPTWAGSVDVHRAAPVARSTFAATLEQQEALDWDNLDEAEAARQQAVLEEAARLLDPAAARVRAGGAAGSSAVGARHWTDFCKVVVSPRTVVSLPGVWTGPAEHSLAAGWGAAAGDLLGGAGGGLQMVEEGVDVVRLLAEACDSLAGFQILVDDQTGFGAYAAAVLAEVVEDFPGRPRVLFSLRQPGAWSGAAEAAGPGLPGGVAAPVSTAQMTARARGELSEALALCRMSELASLYIPLAAPAVQAPLPYLTSYNPLLPFHSSAVLAAAVDSAMLPTRLTGLRTPLGESVGNTDLHSLVQLLRPAAAGLAAVHLALPCPALPADLQQLQRQLDTRLRPPHDSSVVVAAAAAASAAAAEAARLRKGSGTAAAPAQPPPVRSESVYGSTVQLVGLEQLASLTPGISGRDDTAVRGACASRAESYCLRGARTDAGPASTSSAIEALDSLLLQRAHRMCVRHRCATPMPLAVPLPFPDLFSPVVSLHGDIMLTRNGGNGRGGSPTSGKGPKASGAVAGGCGNALGPGSVSSAAAAGVAAAAAAEAALTAVSVGPGGRAAGQGVASVCILTRLQATSEFAGWVRGVQARWVRAAGAAAGRGVLDAWEVGRDDAAEVADHLHELVGRFAEDDDDHF